MLMLSCPILVVMDRLVVSLDFLEFPPTHTCDGGNQSPRLTFKGLKSSSVVVMVFNPFKKSCCSFTPWIIWNIPPAGEPSWNSSWGQGYFTHISCAGCHGLWDNRQVRVLRLAR